MKKVYEVIKYVLADDVVDAMKQEKSVIAHSVLLTKHSEDLYLDTLHLSTKINGKEDKAL